MNQFTNRKWRKSEKVLHTKQATLWYRRSRGRWQRDVTDWAESRTVLGNGECTFSKMRMIKATEHLAWHDMSYSDQAYDPTTGSQTGHSAFRKHSKTYCCTAILILFSHLQLHSSSVLVTLSSTIKICLHFSFLHANSMPVYSFPLHTLILINMRRLDAGASSGSSTKGR